MSKNNSKEVNKKTQEILKKLHSVIDGDKEFKIEIPKEETESKNIDDGNILNLNDEVDAHIEPKEIESTKNTEAKIEQEKEEESLEEKDKTDKEEAAEEKEEEVIEEEERNDNWQKAIQKELEDDIDIDEIVPKKTSNKKKRTDIVDLDDDFGIADNLKSPAISNYNDHRTLDLLEDSQINKTDSMNRKPLETETKENLISDKVAEETSSIIENISKQFTKSELQTEGKNIDTFLKELMKPMLKEWLDKNLPNLVKEIVTKEIKKIIPK